MMTSCLQNFMGQELTCSAFHDAELCSPVVQLELVEKVCSAQTSLLLLQVLFLVGELIPDPAIAHSRIWGEAS